MALLTGRLRGVLAGLVAAAVMCPAARAQEVTEPDVKAAFLYNFTRFVEWPEDPSSPPPSFRLCVVADHETTAAVQRAMEGESVDGRPVETFVPASAADVRDCRILFVGRTEMPKGGRMLEAVRGRPVLTVSDADRFVTRGGTIGFIREGSRVRFDVNVGTAKRAGLTISSRLLQVARKVEGQRP